MTIAKKMMRTRVRSEGDKRFPVRKAKIPMVTKEGIRKGLARR